MQMSFIIPIKEMIIRGGENHFPAEIENALREHKNISDVNFSVVFFF